MEQEYKNINVNGLAFGLLDEFQVIKLMDNTVRLERYQDTKINVKCQAVRQEWDGVQSVKIDVSPNKKKIDCVIIIARTSANYYTCVGSNATKTIIQSVHSLDEVSSYIRNNFARTILEGENL